jgi:hypothetical protein
VQHVGAARVTVTPRRVRRVLPAALVLAASALAAGCSLSAGQDEFVVYFTPQATDAQKDALRNACPGVGGAVLEPRDRSNLAAARTYPVRYDIAKASPTDRSAVIRCVSEQPGVRGISESDGT